MKIQHFNQLCPEQQPFIVFEVELNNKLTSCIGYELYCCDPTCDCGLANIMVHDAKTGKQLAHLIYGWRPYSYYVKEGFPSSDAKQFVKGMINFEYFHDKQGTTVLGGFQKWLSINTEVKKQLFNDRYEEFKEVISPEPFDEEEELELLLDAFIRDYMAETGVLDDLINSSEHDPPSNIIPFKSNKSSKKF